MKLVPIKPVKPLTLTLQPAIPSIGLGVVDLVSLLPGLIETFSINITLANNQQLVCWSEGLTPPKPGDVIRYELARLEDYYDSQFEFQLLRWQALPSALPLSLLEQLYQCCPQQQLIDRLWSLLAAVPDMAVRHWLWDLLANADFCLAFVQAPASRKHHHSYPGGLLEHSLECAEWVLAIAGSSLNAKEAALAVATALLHDAGKVLMFKANGWAQPDVRHEILTFTVLEPALCRLQASWPQGAFAMRQMLGQPLSREPFSKLPGGHLVKLADQYSAALSARTMAFQRAPAHYQWASLKTSTGQQMFNRIQ